MAISREQLLSHAAFLRAVAGAILDADRADDAVQDAWVAALERPPAEPSALRSWLATVVRRFAFRRLRDDRRRAAVATDVEPPVSGDAAEREELMLRVTQAVLSLDLPQREVVLLRYYEALPPRRIAERLGLTTTAVQSRLRRALDRLRSNLDGDHGATDWRRGLAALIGIESGTRIAPWVAWMSAKTKWTIAAAAIAVAWVSWGQLSGPTEGPPALAASPEVTGIEASAAAPESTRAKPEASGSDRERIVTTRQLRLLGRVVDADRRPVAGAHVAVHVASRATTRSTTAADGTFAVVLPRTGPLEGGVVAWANAGRGLEQWRCDADLTLTDAVAIDIGAVVLTPTAELRVVVADGATVVRGCDVWLRPTWTGWETSRREATTDVRGCAAITELIPGRYRIDVRAPDGRHAGAIATASTAGPTDVLIQLADALTVDVEVTDEADEPREAIEVTAFHRIQMEGGGYGRVLIDEARTGERGIATVSGVAAGDTVDIEARDSGHRSTFSGRVHGQLVRLTLERSPVRTIEWRLSSDSARPDRDAELLLWWPNGPFFAAPSIERDGDIVRITGSIHGRTTLLALSSDGLRARLQLPEPDGSPIEDGGTVAFEPGRTLVIRATDASGEPHAGWRFELVEAAGYRRVVRRGATDANGELVITGLPDGTYSVRDHHGDVAGTFAAGLREGEVHVVTAGERAVVARVLVDGVPRLPARLSLRVKRAHVGPLTEDPDAGTLRFSLWPQRPNESLEVRLFPQRGYSTASATIPAGAAPATIELRVERRAEVTGFVTPPADGEYSLKLQLGNGDQWWTYQHYGSGSAPSNHVFSFRGIPPGKFRLADKLSGMAGPPIEVIAGVAHARAEIDLGELEWVQGVVRVPPGFEPTAAHVTTDSALPESRRVAVAADGTFAFRALRGQTLRVAAHHDELRAPPAVELHGGARELELILVSR